MSEGEESLSPHSEARANSPADSGSLARSKVDDDLAVRLSRVLSWMSSDSAPIIGISTEERHTDGPISDDHPNTADEASVATFGRRRDVLPPNTAPMESHVQLSSPSASTQLKRSRDGAKEDGANDAAGDSQFLNLSKRPKMSHRQPSRWLNDLSANSAHHTGPSTFIQGSQATHNSRPADIERTTTQTLGDSAHTEQPAPRTRSSPSELDRPPSDARANVKVKRQAP
ncbi:hypothetical protein I317_01086 [Kwoniella heveanensis CBS 569]|uniref:Uncharacterized protein n=1 Tax=Kwoniella heveanensis BCC8398 TaxID=1296120 RepID=A0A1B9GUP7_9TREE|nr:hypothetical protein I316_03646 [Kwoniella heveanensis BCC8398]OCF45035.1 hypothetical protein I317_01086 [Kwoniella heveanensis CBS 569]